MIKTLWPRVGSIAKAYGISIQTCGTNGDYTRYGIRPSGCMTLDILGSANGIAFKNLKHKGMRQAATVSKAGISALMILA